MSTVQEPVEGHVLCDATAAACCCAKDAGHVEAGDPNHACDPRVCTGSWSGMYDPARYDGGTDWRPVTAPQAVTL